MPGTSISDAPSVPLSFANAFWGKDDAGVTPMLSRMHSAKVTSDELKAFYTVRAQIEEEFARKLLNLSRKPLGSSESGTLRMSLDVIRAEMEAMGKAHTNNAQKIKSELEEPLAAFAGAMKERRKIVQAGIEKLHKVKMQQTAVVNKARDRYEQDSLKIKGYLAQGHMVMGQEERKNKAKLEKTQIQLSSTSNEYEASIKVLEETTGRWNRDWKAACDKFQDLEEERVDFMKSSLWTLANVLSEVCVSDDGSCEKMRLSLEDCDVEKDIMNFIRESGTGQEIPDPPKFIDFCRADIDEQSVASAEEYSVAQFQRTINPAFRTSSPQPSTFESHHDPTSDLARDMGHQESDVGSQASSRGGRPGSRMTNPQQFVQSQFGDAGIPKIPYNENPPDGMTQFCRLPPFSDRSSQASPVRPGSRDSQSEYSNPTSFSSIEPIPTTKQAPPPQLDERQVQKKRSTFFASPFSRRSKNEKENAISSSVSAQHAPRPASRNAFAQGFNGGGGRRNLFGGGSGGTISNRPVSRSPEPVDPRASFQLNVGNNVFDVSNPDKTSPARAREDSQQRQQQEQQQPMFDPTDPIAAALEELKLGGRNASTRVTADRYHGLATPAPGSTAGNAAAPAPPPAYNQPYGSSAQTQNRNQNQMSRLGAPQPAFTSKAMQQTTQRYVNQAAGVFGPGGGGTSSNANPAHPRSQSRSAARGGSDHPSRAAGPQPPRPTSPRPQMHDSYAAAAAGQHARSASPNPYGGGSVGGGNRARAHSGSPAKPRAPHSASYGGGGAGYASQGSSPGGAHQARPGSRAQGGYGGRPASRGMSPSPQYAQGHGRQGSFGRGDPMALQLAGGSSDGPYGSVRGMTAQGRRQSQYGGSMEVSMAGRSRSKSVADGMMYTPDGRPILHYARAMFVYQAAIAEELSFQKGDTVAVLRHQDDGWWEAQVMGKNGRPGLVPSNYLQTI